MTKEETGRRAGNIILALGIIYLIAAFVLMINVHIHDNRAAEKSEAVLTKLEEMIPDESGSGTAGVVSDTLEVIDIEGSSYTGILSIPDKNLSWPVEDRNGSGKELPACTGGSPYEDTFSITGPDYKSIFGKLGGLEKGDEVVFTDIYGNLTKYKVESTGRRVTRNASKASLTLTAEKMGAAQYAVSCVRE
ncbi:MAG: hypothetical protein ACOYJI_05700 [Anaerovoracaceae bacterium]|jgi:hypothetical protein